MTALAQMAVKTKPSDASDSDNGVIDGPFNPSNQNLWAGKPRADGYPNYAVTCDFKKDSCSFLNGEGSQLQDSVEHLYSNTITVVRNADVLSGKYTCRHGLCIDSQGNLVGRVSAAVAQATPAVMQ